MNVIIFPLTLHTPYNIAIRSSNPTESRNSFEKLSTQSLHRKMSSRSPPLSCSIILKKSKPITISQSLTKLYGVATQRHAHKVECTRPRNIAKISALNHPRIQGRPETCDQLNGNFRLAQRREI